MTIYDSISFLAPFLEAFTYFLLFEAFLEREKKKQLALSCRDRCFVLLYWYL